MSPTEIPLAQLRAEVLSYYGLKSRNSWFKARQVFDLLAALGVQTTAELTTATVLAFIESAREGRSPHTVNGLLDYLRAACNYAEDEGYVRRSPFGRRRRLKLWAPPSHRGRHHSREAIAAVLALLRAESGTWAGGRLHAAAALVAYTGLRKMEALCLRCADLDLSCATPGPFLTIVARRPLKTVASAAPVPIPPPLAEILAEWLPRCRSEWAIPAKRLRTPWTGGPRADRATEALKAAGLRAGVAGFTFLTLRHSWATHAEFWGIGETMVQRILRHTRPLTQRHYRHPDLPNMVAAARSIRFDAPPAPSHAG